MIYDVVWIRNKSNREKTERDSIRVEANDKEQAKLYAKQALKEQGKKHVTFEWVNEVNEQDAIKSSEPIWKCPEKKITLRHKNKLKRMLTRLVIEVADGEIVHIASNTDNVEIRIIEQIFNEQKPTAYKPDSVMTNEGLDEYFTKTVNKEGMDVPENTDNVQVLSIYKDKNGKEIKKGDRVLVPDPNDTDIHNHEFEGSVHSFRDVYVIVQDNEENGYSIEPERLEVLND